MSKAQKTLFTASIILNILLLGLAGGLIYKKHHAPAWQSFKSELSPQAQEIVQQNFDSGRAEIRPLLSDLMKEREQLVMIMKAEPFDATAFDGAANRVQDVQKEISETKAQSIKTLMEKLPYEERVKLADNLARLFTWDRKGGGRHGKAGPVERVP